jgi:hypothetical protein
VNIVVSGAVCPRVNGTYTPLSQESDGWPVYTKLGDRDMFLVYAYPEWLIQNTSDRFRDLESRRNSAAGSVDAKRVSRAFVRLPCNPPNYPELRAEGQHLNVESSEFMGGLYQSSQHSCIEIVTEQEMQAMRASEMAKLDISKQAGIPMEVQQQEPARAAEISMAAVHIELPPTVAADSSET